MRMDFYGVINTIIIIIAVLCTLFGSDKKGVSEKTKEKIDRAIRLLDKTDAGNDGAQFEENEMISTGKKEETGREIPLPEKAAAANGGAQLEDSIMKLTEIVKEKIAREIPRLKEAAAESGRDLVKITETIKEKIGREIPLLKKAEAENGGAQSEEYEARKRYFQDAVRRAAKNAEYVPTPENIGISRICAAIAQIDAFALEHGDDSDEVYSFEQEMGMFCSIVMISKVQPFFKARAISVYDQINAYLWDNRFFAPAGREQISHLYDRVIEYYREKKNYYDIIRMYTSAHGNTYGWSEFMTKRMYALFAEALGPIGEVYPDGCSMIRTDVQRQWLPGEEQRNAWNYLTNNELERLMRETGEKIVNAMDFCFNEVHSVCRKELAQEERRQLLSALIVLAAGTLQEKAPLADEKAFMLDIAGMLNRLRISGNIESLPTIVTDYESSVYLDLVLSEARKTENEQAVSGDHPRGAVSAFIDAMLMKALAGAYGVMKDESITKCWQDCGSMIREEFVGGVANIARDYGLVTEEGQS